MNVNNKILQMLESYRDGCHDDAELRVAADTVLEATYDCEPDDEAAVERCCDDFITAIQKLKKEAYKIRVEKCFIYVEYDPAYCGGNYNGTGSFQRVPLLLIEEKGVEEAFRAASGFDPMHIIHYCLDEVVDEDDNFVEV